MIRPAHTGDATDIAAIWNDVIADSTATFTTDPKTDADLQTMIAARGPAILVVEEGAAVLGFATYGPFRAGPGYAATAELTVHLDAAARGRGLGRALVQALEAQALEEGIHVMVAGISGENTAGVAFHAALGYVETARMPEVGRKFGRWLDLVCMQKTL